MAGTTLTGRYFTDAELFRAEMDRIYGDQWVCAGRAEQIAGAGDYFVRELAGESIIVTRDATGAVRAFFNVCRHRGTRMCARASGRFDGRIQCPYHGWSYGLDGALLGAPHMNAEFRREDYPLHRVRTGEWDGHIFVHLGPEGAIGEHLGGLPAKFANWRMRDLRLHSRIVYEVKANWKLLVLNYNECLHCPMLHPALNRLTDYLGADNEPPAASYVGGAMGFRGAVQTMSVDGRRRRAYLPGLTPAEQRCVLYYAIYPNLMLSLHPDYMMLHRLWPLAVDRTEVECEWYFHPEEMAQAGFTADDVVEFWDGVNREDWAISELSQAGVSSRAYTPGPYSPRESLLGAFDDYVRGRVG